MLPFINILGITLPMYGIMAIVGFAAALFAAVKLTMVYSLPKQDLLFGAVYMVIGIIIGAKIMYFITYIPGIIKHFDVVAEYPWETIMLVFSGYVFYGGLIGGAIGIVIYAKQYKLKVLQFADVIAPVIPLFHGFGRIGCFLGGCCYGMEYHGPLAVKFPYNELIPELNQTERFPVQLLEAGLNFILFGILYYYGFKKRKSGKTLGLYLLCYTVIRIVTECFRGDIVRGVSSGGISTSQIISLLLIPLGIWLVVRKEKNETA